MTFDGIKVSFFPEQFYHAFFRDSSPTTKDKACFERARAERMYWIKALLEDASAEVYRRCMPDGKMMRIALWRHERYAVIIQLRKNRKEAARFITAYVVASASALAKMRGNPRW
jgi:hypothetical protein